MNLTLSAKPRGTEEFVIILNHKVSVVRGSWCMTTIAVRRASPRKYTPGENSSLIFKFVHELANPGNISL